MTVPPNRSLQTPHQPASIADPPVGAGYDDEYIINSIKHAKALRAIVLELYGTGNLSARKGGLIECLQAAIAKVGEINGGICLLFRLLCGANRVHGPTACGQERVACEFALLARGMRW